MVGGSGGAFGVVVGAGAGRAAQGVQRPLVERVGEAAVAGERASTTRLLPDARVIGAVPA